MPDSSPSHRIVIALLGKGSTNHLHRPEVVDAFRAKGADLSFWVRSDYVDLLQRIPGCDYQAVSFELERGWRARVCGLLEQIRSFYPSRDPGRRREFAYVLRDLKGWRPRAAARIMRWVAGSRQRVRCCAWIEQRLHRADGILGVDPASVDQLVLLGVGTVNSELEGRMTLWARRHGLPVIHVVGNYDNLSSKGFRGVDVERLLVWGPNMRRDANEIHGIPLERITEIGSIRYNGMSRILQSDKAAFLRSIGLDPARKTILFAGFQLEFHYFEMLDVYERIRKAGEPWQLILRLYPNKALMRSVYLKPMLQYARSLPGVYVSLADPHAADCLDGREVLQIEERELWNALNASDVLINIFSTIALEGCLLDKPVINMWYFPRPSKTMHRAPVFQDYSLSFHNRRIVSYGAIKTARHRAQLIEFIREAIVSPGVLETERRATVLDEVGVLDGRACERLVEACWKHYAETQNPRRPR